MLETVEKDVDPQTEELASKDMHEWAVFAVPGATSAKGLLSSKQLNAEVSRLPIHLVFAVNGLCVTY